MGAHGVPWGPMGSHGRRYPPTWQLQIHRRGNRGSSLHPTKKSRKSTLLLPLPLPRMMLPAYQPLAMRNLGGRGENGCSIFRGPRRRRHRRRCIWASTPLNLRGQIPGSIRAMVASPKAGTTTCAKTCRRFPRAGGVFKRSTSKNNITWKSLPLAATPWSGKV